MPKTKCSMRAENSRTFVSKDSRCVKYHCLLINLLKYLNHTLKMFLHFLLILDTVTQVSCMPVDQVMVHIGDALGKI